MAKRELSSTLKNLKFMQRGANKEEKSKKEEEEPVPHGNFQTFITTKKCVVIMEGDPSPGASRGRMSFQSFNPSIDKLNEEAANPPQSEDNGTWSENQGQKTSNRENGSAQNGPDNLKEEASNGGEAVGDLKRKQGDVQGENFSNKSPKLVEGEQGPSSNSSRKKSNKQPKQGKLDWNVLRPPKSKTKKG